MEHLRPSDGMGEDVWKPAAIVERRNVALAIDFSQGDGGEGHDRRNADGEKQVSGKATLRVCRQDDRRYRGCDVNGKDDKDVLAIHLRC